MLPAADASIGSPDGHRRKNWGKDMIRLTNLCRTIQTAAVPPLTKPLRLAHRGHFAGLRSLCLLSVALVLAACATPQRDYSKTVTRALPEASQTRLAKRSASLGNPGDGRSGVKMLSNGEDALAARLLLSDRSEQTIDAQYYLLHDDAAGHLFSASLLRAADRGVRVRLLLDDMDTSDYDAFTQALDTHPNIEIRLMNPFWRDKGFIATGLTEFTRINRRMHNKSMTFDNAFTIVGGRNIGAEYFLAKSTSNYVDLDILATGPVVRDVSDFFDDYWNSSYAVPARAVINRPQDMSLDQARSGILALETEARTSQFGEALIKSGKKTFQRSSFDVTWVPATVYADPVEKLGGNADDLTTLARQLKPYFDAAEDELHIVSAYFVPLREGVDLLAALEDRGVDVEVVTNSNGSNDVAPVYAHYAKTRKPLLRAGVDLYELRTDLFQREQVGTNWLESRSGLHTKAFTIDDRKMFIGSFNFDPRSVRINTEMGIMIDSVALTAAALGQLEDALPKNAYRLRLTDDDRIIWETQGDDGSLVRYRSEPTASTWDQIVAGFLALLPIGSQL
jgi:putative cardiolipin synthase